MDINHCEVFLHVVDSGSFSAAAQETGYTQSAVSYIVKNLEKEFGLKLIDRSRTGIKISKNGTNLLPFIRKIVEANRELNNEIFQINNLVKGEVVLGGTYSMKILFFLPIIEKFHKEYPLISFKFLDGSGEDIEIMLAEGKIDLGICTYRKHMPGHYFFIKDDPLLAVIPNDCNDYANGVFPIEDLGKFDFITTSLDDEFGILEEMKEKKIICNCPIQMNDTFTAVSAVERNLGVTILPELSMKTKKQYQVKIAGLQPPHYRRLCLFSSGSHALTPAAKIFYEFCVQELPGIAQNI